MFESPCINVAGTMALHLHKLEVLNMIYCHVVSSEEVLGFLFELSQTGFNWRLQKRPAG